MFVGAHATELSLVTSLGEHDAHDGAQDSAQERLSPTRILTLSPAFKRRLQLGCLLGRGAYGIVFQAVQLSLSRPVAIKFLTTTSDKEGLERFLNEGRFLASIRHPNVVEVIEMGEVEGFPYILSEYLPGGTLSERMQEARQWPLAEALPVVLDALAGLAACHGAGVVHRDVKPANILFAEAGTAKIADLGLAKLFENPQRLTQTGVMVGTPRYVAPEQILGSPATPGADIYAMGTILYEMLAGRPVFAAPKVSELLRLHVQRPPDPLRAARPDLPEGLAALVESSLAKRPESRPRSAEDFAQALQAAASPRPSERPTDRAAAPASPSAVAPAHSPATAPEGASPASRGSPSPTSPAMPPPTAAVATVATLVALGLLLLGLASGSIRERIIVSAARSPLAPHPVPDTTSPASSSAPTASGPSGAAPDPLVRAWAAMEPIDRRRAEYVRSLREPDAKLDQGQVRAALDLLKSMLQTFEHDDDQVRSLSAGALPAGASPGDLAPAQLAFATHAAAVRWILHCRKSSIAQRCDAYAWAIKNGKDSLLYLAEVEARQSVPRDPEFLSPLRVYLSLVQPTLRGASSIEPWRESLIAAWTDLYDAANELRGLPLSPSAQRLADQAARELDSALAARAQAPEAAVPTRIAGRLFHLGLEGAVTPRALAALDDALADLQSIRPRMDRTATQRLDGLIDWATRMRDAGHRH